MCLVGNGGAIGEAQSKAHQLAHMVVVGDEHLARAERDIPEHEVPCSGQGKKGSRLDGFVVFSATKIGHNYFKNGYKMTL